jgi:hypothetical protein
MRVDQRARLGGSTQLLDGSFLHAPVPPEHGPPQFPGALDELDVLDVFEVLDVLNGVEADFSPALYESER